jgi:hypothetical protein
VKFAFIHAEGAKLSTSLLCRALKVSRSGFYAWSKRPPSRRDVEDSKLVPVIRACHAQSGALWCEPPKAGRTEDVAGSRPALRSAPYVTSSLSGRS